MTTKHSGHFSAIQRVSPGHHRYYAREIERAKVLLNTPATVFGVASDNELDRNFISARHREHFNVFDRSWISSLEDDAV